MTFLELVQELHRETGAGSTAPATTLNQVGEAGRLVGWIKQANLYIQNKHTDWNFLWNRYSFSTVADTYIYVPIVGIDAYDRGTFLIDDEPLDVVDYLDMKSIKRETGSGLPFQAVIMPDETIRLDQTPDAIYTVRYDYWATAMDFDATTENDANTTLIPVRFHDTIIAKALTYYAMYENAPEIMQRGQDKFVEWMPQLEANQLPGDRHMNTTAEGNDMVIEVG
jgi:hypothetical protein